MKSITFKKWKKTLNLKARFAVYYVCYCILRKIYNIFTSIGNGFGYRKVIISMLNKTNFCCKVSRDFFLNRVLLIVIE